MKKRLPVIVPAGMVIIGLIWIGQGSGLIARSMMSKRIDA